MPKDTYATIMLVKAIHEPGITFTIDLKDIPSPID